MGAAIFYIAGAFALGSAISVLIFLMVALIAFVFIKLLGTNLAQQRGET